jgi:hypothetical protein
VLNKPVAKAGLKPIPAYSYGYTAS